MRIKKKEKLAEMLRIVEDVRVMINHSTGTRGFAQRISPQSLLNLIEKSKVKFVDAILNESHSERSDHTVLTVTKVEDHEVENE